MDVFRQGGRVKKPSMSERLLARTKDSAERATQNVNPADSIASKPPVTMPGQLGAFRLEAKRYQDKIDQLEAKLHEAEKNSTSLEIRLDEIHEASGRKRNLTHEQFEELRENLRQNELVTPITVRLRPEGGYEIVSGHNRVEAYRELGRATIAAVVRDTESAQADINAFYANLLQPTLPAYEKYLGFEMLRRLRPQLKQDEIAERAGISKAQVSKLMAFASLPDAAHEILSIRPNLIGADTASTLAGLVRNGKAEKVIEALRKIAEGKFDQTQALVFASEISEKATPTIPLQKETQKTKAPQAETLSFKMGKTPLCSFRKTETTLRLDFKSSEHAAAIAQEIQAVLERYATLAKAGSKQ